MFCASSCAFFARSDLSSKAAASMPAVFGSVSEPDCGLPSPQGASRRVRLKSECIVSFTAARLIPKSSAVFSSRASSKVAICVSLLRISSCKVFIRSSVAQSRGETEHDVALLQKNGFVSLHFARRATRIGALRLDAFEFSFVFRANRSHTRRCFTAKKLTLHLGDSLFKLLFSCFSTRNCCERTSSSVIARSLSASARRL